MKKCIILANGKSPDKKIIRFLKKKGYKTLICADGGANSARRLNLIPDYIIGDLDSISENNLQFYTGKSEIIKINRQNDTDLEKCLKFAIRKKFNECFLLGTVGDRLDHSFANLSIVLKYSDKIKINLISERSLLTTEKGTVEFASFPGETISLYAFNEKTVITSKGLKYKLDNDQLVFGKKESTSNVATAEKIHLNITGGKIFLIRDIESMRKHDFI
ncbi:MAG: thiamine diphosphokinase [Ignavibacteriales bacterium]|nr:thiamine diphosphokinase [Ignavibacteriales bacterium]